jgi:Proteasome activator pa28 beta subunit
VLRTQSSFTKFSSFSVVEVLAELHRAQESAYNLRDAARQDYLARAKICSKIVKYPNIEDYAVCNILLIDIGW